MTKENNNSKKAMLVTFALTTRVIVDENATEEQIIEAASRSIELQGREYGFDWSENVDRVVDDTECPYDPTSYNDIIPMVLWDKYELREDVVNGMDVVVSPYRMRFTTLPQGIHRYEIRESDFSEKWATIEKEVTVNFGATMLTFQELDFGDSDYIEITSHDDGDDGELAQKDSFKLIDKRIDEICDECGETRETFFRLVNDPKNEDYVVLVGGNLFDPISFLDYPMQFVVYGSYGEAEDDIDDGDRAMLLRDWLAAIGIRQ